jgi:hypothetical protein
MRVGGLEGGGGLAKEIQPPMRARLVHQIFSMINQWVVKT